MANASSSTEFWLQPQFQPTSPLAVLRSPPCKKGAQVVKKAENLKFPIDFFEHCQLTNDVEVGVVCPEGWVGVCSVMWRWVWFPKGLG